jgi:hypothetical protein
MGSRTRIGASTILGARASRGHEVGVKLDESFEKWKIKNWLKFKLDHKGEGSSPPLVDSIEGARTVNKGT